MTAHSKEPPTNPEKSLFWFAKLVVLLFLVISTFWAGQMYEETTNLWAYVGFFVSCGGIFALLYKVIFDISIEEGKIKYFVHCELPSRLNLIVLLCFSSMIVILTALKSKKLFEQIDQIMFIPLVVALVFIPAKQTRTATILLVLSVIYFFSATYTPSQINPLMGGMFLVVLLSGFLLLLLQKPKNEAFLDWIKELQEKRRESKILLHFLSGTFEAKQIGDITHVSFEEVENAQRASPTTPRKSVWDLENESSKIFEKEQLQSTQKIKKEFANELAKELAKIKEQNSPFHFRGEHYIISAIDQSEKHLKDIEQHIKIIKEVKPALEKVKLQLSKITPRPSISIVNVNTALEHIDSFHKNITPSLKEAIDIFDKIKPYIQQQESKRHELSKEIQKTIDDILKLSHKPPEEKPPP
jgi:hypothetical protein